MVSETFTLGKRAFAYWNTTIHDWYVETGDYEIQIAKSAREVELVQKARVESSVTIPKTYTLNTTMGELFRDPKAQPILEKMNLNKGQASSQADHASGDTGAVTAELKAAMMNDMPLCALLNFSPDLKKETLQGIIDMLNQ